MLDTNSWSDCHFESFHLRTCSRNLIKNVFESLALSSFRSSVAVLSGLLNSFDVITANKQLLP